MNKIEWRSRDELAGVLNKLGLTGFGAEVGVERAHHAMQLRRAWEGKKLFLVDKWEVNFNYAACNQDRHTAAHTEAMRNIAAMGDGAEVIQQWSTDAAKILKDLGVQLDFVYLDADHSYDAVKADIEAWLPLIKPGGIIAGHDFVSDGYHVPGDPVTAYVSPNDAGEREICPFGVRKAVLEKWPADQVAVTSPDTDGGWQSWLVRV